MCMIGTGTTFVLSGGLTESVGRVISYGGFTEEVADINDDDIGSTGHMKYCPGVKIDHSELELTVVFDPDQHPNLTLGRAATPITGTLTFPTPVGGAAGATLAGTGHVRLRGFDGIEDNERIEGSVNFRFDGETPPAWSPST